MKLCLINPSRHPRPEIFGLAQALSTKGTYDIIILTPSENNDIYNINHNIEVVSLPSTFLNIGNLIVTLPKIYEWNSILSNVILNKKCDLIHTCDYEYLSSVFPVIKKKQHRLPITIVSDALLGFSHYTFGSPAIDLASTIYTATLGKLILSNYDKVIFLYSDIVNEVKRLGLSPYKMAIIPNGIDAKKAAMFKKTINRSNIKEKYGISEDEKVILYVGRLAAVKRVNLLINIIKKLICDGFKVKAIVVGTGPQLDSLKILSKAVEANVIFTGHITEKEKNECYSIADLFILPSLSEGLPTVLLEAAAFEVPIIASKTNGIPDIVIHNKTGFLVDREERFNYYLLAKEILSDECLAQKLANNARNHVIANYSWDYVASKYDKIFRSLSKR